MNLARQLGWTALGRFGATAINLAALIIYSRLLGPAEFGRFALAQAAAILAYSVLFYWLVSSITRMAADQGESAPAFRAAVVTGFLGASVVTAVFGILGAWAGILLSMKDSGFIAGIVVLAALGEASYMRVLEHFRAFQRATPYATLLALRATLALTFGWIAIEFVGRTGEMALFGHAIGCLAAAVLMEVLFPDPIRYVGVWRSLLKEIWIFGSPLSIALIFRTAIQRVDRFVIGAFFGTEAVGLYALAFDFANRALGIPLMVINVVTYPAMTQAWSKEDAAETTRLAELNWLGMLMIGLPSAIGLIVIAPDALAILFGAEFATEPAPLIASIAVFTMLVEAIKLYHLDIAFMLRRDNRDQIIITGWGFLVNVAGCALFIPVFGSVAAACIALATGLFLAVLAWHRGQRFREMPMPVSPLFGIFIGCGLMGATLLGMGRSGDILDLALRVVVAALIFGGTVYTLDVGKCRTAFMPFTRGAN